MGKKNKNNQLTEEEILEIAKALNKGIEEFKKMKNFNSAKEYGDYIVNEKDGECYSFDEGYYIKSWMGKSEFDKFIKSGNDGDKFLEKMVGSDWSRFKDVSLEKYKQYLMEELILKYSEDKKVSKHFEMSNILDDEKFKRQQEKQKLKKFSVRMKEGLEDKISQFGADEEFIITFLTLGGVGTLKYLVDSGIQVNEFIGCIAMVITCLGICSHGLESTKNFIKNKFNDNEKSLALENVIEIISNCKSSSNVSKDDMNALATLEDRIQQLRNMYGKHDRVVVEGGRTR